MIQINEHYLKLQASYLFSDIAKRVNAFQAANLDKKLIRMGIGDVTEPLPAACLEAFHAAIDEMGQRGSFRGYGPEQGYDFLRTAIATNEYQAFGCDIQADEIFVSDGAKCDTGNIQEIFGLNNRVAVPDPVYPVYVDTNVMAGRTGHFVQGRYEGLTYLECTPDNGYIPALPTGDVDLIYLCFPNNPTGAVATRQQLTAWVEYALSRKAIILYDSAYWAFIRNPEIPKSIYEIPGARECAIEFRSFSKNAGFTGTRCAFTVVPKELKAYDSAGEAILVHKLWNRRHTTKFNGVSYPVQKAAAAIYTESGKVQVQALIDGYMANAALIRDTMQQLGYKCVGGDNAPYVWIHTGTDSWEYFDRLLNKAAVVCTPGAGFGKCGQGHVRLSAFNNKANVLEALDRIRAVVNQ